MSQLRLFAVAFENTAYRWGNVRRGAWLFRDRRRRCVARFEEGDVEMNIETRGEHRIGLGRLADFANGTAVLNFDLAVGRGRAVPSDHGIFRGGAPIFEFARLL